MFSITKTNEGLGRQVYYYDVQNVCVTQLGCFSVIIDGYGGVAFLVVSDSEIFQTGDFSTNRWRTCLKVVETVNNHFYKKNNIPLKEIIIPQFLPVRKDEEEAVIQKIRSMGIRPRLEYDLDIIAVPCVRRVISPILKNLMGKTEKLTTKEGLLDKERIIELIMKEVINPGYDSITNKAFIRKLRRRMIKYNERTFFKDELGNARSPAEFILEESEKPIDLPLKNKWVIELRKD